MPVTAVVGAQWGDEGKGRVVDVLAQNADMVIRFQGGDNAGHTVSNQWGEFKLHLIPAGIFNPQTTCIIGTGTVVNPQTLLEEIKSLEAAGISTANLWLSERAHMVMPYHRELDELEERARGKEAIGTTKRGIGPAYADKSARNGLRLGDITRPDCLEGRLDHILPSVNRKFELLEGEPVDGSALYEECMRWRAALEHRIVDVAPRVRAAVERDDNILLEGQLGVMRDLDWGIYPYVTSSNPTAAFAAVGAGIPPQRIQNVIGVVKAFSTAVGEGPLVTELHDETAERLRRGGPKIGWEFGATTGRPRRCGWFDGVAIQYAAWLNGFTALAVTKLDVLDGFDAVKICIAYRLRNGDLVTDTVPDTPLLADAEPVYETLPGWSEPTSDAQSWDDLPAAAQNYLERIESLAGVPIRFVSVGPAREQMFSVDKDAALVGPPAPPILGGNG